jgi:hypothetical protein
MRYVSENKMIDSDTYKKLITKHDNVRFRHDIFLKK